MFIGISNQNIEIIASMLGKVTLPAAWREASHTQDSPDGKPALNDKEGSREAAASLHLDSACNSRWPGLGEAEGRDLCRSDLTKGSCDPQSS